MPNTRKPRSGSMGYWPRKRAKRPQARVRSWTSMNNAQLLGFCGYKVGMTQIFVTDNKKTSLTKGEEIPMPVTIIECPPMKIASIRFYKKTSQSQIVCSEILAENLDKEVARTITLPKNKDKKEDVKKFDSIRLIVYTQPKLIGIKKKPDMIEIALGGKKDDQLTYAKSMLGKDININDVFKEGQQIDIHAITKGKGFQGPVKRFGVKIRSHKSEKTKRGPGSLGGWKGHGKFMYRVAHAGQMGYHQRTEYNKWIIKIGDKVEEINPKGGFIRYGLVKNKYVLVKGSIGGHKKRLIKFINPIRKNKHIPEEAPSIVSVNLSSQQGR
jgi:large subunit ribosomal protein L3